MRPRQAVDVLFVRRLSAVAAGACSSPLTAPISTGFLDDDAVCLWSHEMRPPTSHDNARAHVLVRESGSGWRSHNVSDL